MNIVVATLSAIERLFGPLADEAGRASQVIVRMRKFSALTLARTFVLGFLQKPTATDEDLAQAAAQCGVAVTPQAIDQRHTPALVAFLRELFGRAVRVVVAGGRSPAPLLDRFTAVTLLDSTVISLPESQRHEFPGCGGGRGGGEAAVKLQVELDLKSGAVSHVEVEPGRTSDGGSVRQNAIPAEGALRVADLGYFSVPVFAAIIAAKAHFLSRLHYKTGVRTLEKILVDLLPWLARPAGPWVDERILLGPEQLACRLIAWRLPPDQAARRRRKRREETRSKYGREPTADRLAWCDWTILVTSVPSDLLTPAEAAILYRARWQIELLFKRWKGQDRVALLSGSTDDRQLVRVWARLLAALVQHWLVIAGVWGDPSKSLAKACEAVRAFAGRLMAAVTGTEDLARILADLARVLEKTCRRNKRKKPGTFELLNDWSLLDFRLT